MSRRELGSLLKLTYKALDDIGPMSRSEMAVLLRRTDISVRGSLRKLRERKLIHISKYERQPDGVKGRCIPIYAVGDLEDAQPPMQLDASERDRRYRKRHSAIIACRSYNKTLKSESLGIWRGLV